jgi:beta-glucanase (GH16 family)
MRLTEVLAFFCIDYNSNNVYLDNENLNIALTPEGGTRISTTDYYHYGTFEIEMMMAKGQNVVTAIVLLAENNDEIDYEFVGKDTNIIQSNLYWKGEALYEVNAEYHKTDLDLTSSFNNYTILWRPESLEWFLNGQLLRKETKFPNSPSKLHIGIWGAGVSNWGGSGLVFNDVTPSYKSVVKRIEMKTLEESSSSTLKTNFFVNYYWNLIYLYQIYYLLKCLSML